MEALWNPPPLFLVLSLFHIINFVIVLSSDELRGCPQLSGNRWTKMNVSFWHLGTRKVEDAEDFDTVIAEFSCRDDEYRHLHQEIGLSTVITCRTSERMWSAVQPLCVPTCSPPANGPHLQIEFNLDAIDEGPNKGRYLIGTLAKYSCQPDDIFLLNGTSIRRCQLNGSFEDHPPHCSTK